ncbi:MAG TPA: sigma-E factor negative regulatory protein [Solimonas sp.]
MANESLSAESLSALLDGECSPEEMERLLDEMERSPALKDAWSQLCLSREIRSGTRIVRGQVSICEGVMAGIAAAPAPMSDKVVPLASRRPSAPPVAAPAVSPRARSAFDWRALSGWAVAASVALVAVGLNLSGRETTTNIEAGGMTALPQVTSPVSVPLSTRRPRNLQTVSLTPEDEDLRSYLIEHSNTLAERGMGGALSYARFAAYTTDPRTSAQPQPAVATTSAEQP